MRSKIAILFTALFGLSSLPAHAENGLPAIALVAPASQAKAIPQRGTLYQVRHQGNTTWLFGTIHVGTASFFPLEDEATQALAQAGKLVVELDILNSAPFMSAVNKYGLYGINDTIEKHLSPDNFAQLQQTLLKFDIPYARVARMKPWMITNFLMGLDLERNGYARDHGIEFFLLTQAKSQSKTVQELETVDYQLSLFDGMTEKEQEQYLRENLADIKDGTALKKAAMLIDAWGSGNGGLIEAMLADAMRDKSVSSEFTQRILLDKRNPEMTAKIEALLKTDKSTFVGVGLLHLIGENGVPKLLQQRGYDVRKVY
jgi:uncharacterized protein YbaP (TraB family)